MARRSSIFAPRSIPFREITANASSIYWSPERNAVRRVVDLERKQGQLRLAVQRFGKGKPSWLEILVDRDRRPPAAQRQTRFQYRRLLGQVLKQKFPEWSVDQLVSTADLERSFSPVYTRGLLRRG